MDQPINTNVLPLFPQPIICAYCGQAGHAMNVCPDRPGDALPVEDQREAA